MQSMPINKKPWLKMFRCAGFLAAVIVLLVLAGCAADRKIGSDMADRQSSATREFVVEPLQDGREGFIIRENTQMDEPSRRDFDRAVSLMQNQEYGRAAELLEKIIARSPDITAPYINLAIAYQQLGRLEEAEEHLKSALALVPEHPVACNEYGLLFRRTGRFDKARAIYEKALDRFPDYYPLHKNLGILCDLYLNDKPCALEHYEIYSRAMVQDKQVQLWIADLQIRLGQN